MTVEAINEGRRPLSPNPTPVLVGKEPPVPVLFCKALVRGYVTKDGKAVAPHEDARPPAPRRREEEGGGGSPVGASRGEEKPEAGPEAPGPKHYRGDGAEQLSAYKVGQRIKVRGHEGSYTVTKVGDGVAWAKGPDGEVEVRQPGAMAKAEPAPRVGMPLLLKACPPGEKKKPAGKAPAKAPGKAEKPAAGASAKPAAGQDGAPQGKPSVPPRGAPDGEHEMEHGDRVAFQHGKVRGEGTIVASGADGAMVLDDQGREHPVRHDNLLGPAESAETPDELPKDENGKPAAIDPDEAEGDGMDGDKGDMGESGKAAGDETAGDAAALAAMDPKALSKIMQAIRALAPLFGGSASKDAAAAKKAAPKKAPAK